MPDQFVTVFSLNAMSVSAEDGPGNVYIHARPSVDILAANVNYAGSVPESLQ